jgi:hypothetical protein
MQISERVFAHELDAAWIIALWKAIHGGDPAPEAVAAQVIAVVAPYLNGAQPSSSDLSFSELEKRFANFGIHIIERSEEENVDALALDSIDEPDINANFDPNYRRTRQYCFQFGRQTVCTRLPEISHRVTAA